MVARIAVYGGDGRVIRSLGNRVRHYESTKRGGARRLGALCAAIKNGGIDVVYVLILWAGHPAGSAIKQLCRNHGVRYVEVRGSHLPDPL